jgi:phenylacetate-coenzyme A ligase PaaK-like adenylate-forming protein
VLSLLAEEQAAGRLRISPGVVIAGGETLEPAEKHRVEHAFNAAVLNVYACSEADYIGFGCSHGWLHVNEDWLILEPVDRAYQPVSPGTASHTVLLTNLANRTQPVIRYDLHDSVTVKPGACPCGSPFAAISVEGRRNELLRFKLSDGREVKVLPMAIGTAVEGVVGLRQYQLVQTGPAAVTLRCSARTGSDPATVRHAAVAEVAAYLARQGVGNVDVSLSDRPPQADPKSGKFHCIVTLPVMPG